METIKELNLKCPYCGNSISREHYNHALEEFKLRATQEYHEQLDKDREQQRKEREEHEQEIEKLKEQHEREKDGLSDKIRQQSISWYGEQVNDLKRRYDELHVRRQKELEESVNQTIAELKQERDATYKKFQELQNNLHSFKAQAREEARVVVEADIEIERNKVREKDIQLRRAEDEASKLKRQLSQNQSELQGEVGEINLFETLKNAFRQDNDIIERSHRGTAYGDIIQQIRMSSGAILETTIVYDNKKADTITPKDIEKAKRYMNIHATDYVIIVSQNLPKRDIKNGFYGEKDGVLLVHPCIIVEVAQQIRKAIIKISKLLASNQEQQSKQSKMYDYIRGQEFSKIIETICETHQAMAKLQDKEEKDHITIWKKRKALHEQFRKVYIDISSGIDAIIQEQELARAKDEPVEGSKSIENISNGDGNGKVYSLS